MIWLLCRGFAFSLPARGWPPHAGEDDPHLPGVIVVSVLLANLMLKSLEPPLQRAPRYTIEHGQLLMGIGLDDNVVVFHHSNVLFFYQSKQSLSESANGISGSSAFFRILPLSADYSGFCRFFRFFPVSADSSTFFRF
jgi:hypothetical protein